MIRLLVVVLVSLLACKETSALEIYADLGPLIVRVHVYGTMKLVGKTGTKEFEDSASGFIVSPDGLVLTAGHVIPDPADFEPDQLWVEAYMPQRAGAALQVGGTAQALKIVKSAQNPFDLGLLKFVSVDKPFAFLRLCDTVGMDEKIQFLGYPQGIKSLAKRVGSIETPANDPDPMVIQMPLAPGDSGGPIFNAEGDVVAIAVGQMVVNDQKIESTNYAVMVRNAISHLDPDTKALIGTSYDPDCNKPLSGKIPTSFSFEKSEPLDVPASGALQHDTLTAPNGYVFSDTANPTIFSFDPSVSTSIASIDNTGKTIDFSTDVKPKQRSDHQIVAEVHKHLTYTLSPDPRSQADRHVSPGADVTAFVVHLGKVTDNKTRYEIALQTYLSGMHAERLVDAVLLKDGTPTSGAASAALAGPNLLNVILNEHAIADVPASVSLDLFVTVEASVTR